jgi:sugar lactone lactonase YvrE
MIESLWGIGRMREGIRKWAVISVLLAMTFVIGCGQNNETSVIEKPVAKASAKPAVEGAFASGFDGADGITIDYAGNMYVGNRKSNMVSRVSKEGKAEDFVKLDCMELLCMTVDKENNIYAAGKNKVFKISPKGEAEEIANGFTCADDLRFDSKGNLYVTDSFENRVYKITPDLEKSIFIDSDEDRTTLGNGWHVTGITFDKDYKNLYIARMKKGEILRYPINSDGTAGAPEIILKDLKEPDHLEIDKQGRLYITLFRRGMLVRLDSAGKVEELSNGLMYYATGIVLGRGGFDENSAYIADNGKDAVFQIKLDGK